MRSDLFGGKSFQKSQATKRSWKRDQYNRKKGIRKFWRSSDSRRMLRKKEHRKASLFSESFLDFLSFFD